MNTSLRSGLAALLVLAAAAPALAGDYTIRPVTITIPAGFEGPLRQDKPGATTVGFTKTGGPKAKTLLQITLHDLGPELGGATDAERASAAAKYLLDFVGGVERRRSNFKRTEPTALTIAGLPAAKLQWTGLLQGRDTVGVMYCFLAGAKIVSFHTQDLGSAPTDAMNEAIAAFEAARIRKR